MILLLQTPCIEIEIVMIELVCAECLYYVKPFFLLKIISYICTPLYIGRYHHLFMIFQLISL